MNVGEYYNTNEHEYLQTGMTWDTVVGDVDVSIREAKELGIIVVGLTEFIAVFIMIAPLSLWLTNVE